MTRQLEHTLFRGEVIRLVATSLVVGEEQRPRLGLSCAGPLAGFGLVWSPEWFVGVVAAAWLRCLPGCLVRPRSCGLRTSL